MIARLSFRTKISLAMIAVLLFLGVFLGVVLSRTAAQALVDDNQKRGISSAVNFAARIAEPLLSTDYLRMKDLVDETMRTVQDVAFVFVQDSGGTPVVHSFTDGFPVGLADVNRVENGSTFNIRLITTGMELMDDVAVPVVIASARLGTVRLGVSHKRIDKEIDRLLGSIFLATAVSVVLAALLGTLLARTVTKKIDLLQRSAQEIVAGNLDIQAIPPAKPSCWKFMSCEKKQCPAYGSTRHRCWYVAGKHGSPGTTAYDDPDAKACRDCTFFQYNTGDEIDRLAEYFDFMAMTLQKRMDDIQTIQDRMLQSQKLESIGQLAAGVAHELNTPIGIILGYTQLMLQDFATDSEYHEWLVVQEKHLRICKRIVSDLLRFSRTTETDKKPVCLNELLDQVVAVVEHTLGLDKITVTRQFDRNLPLVFGDQEKLQQVFLNLLNNAHDAIGSDGTVSVATQFDVEKTEAVVSVADTGTGIPEDVLPRIFDPFFTTKPVGKGTGLGLSVTFGIIRDHGGYIEVGSHTAAMKSGIHSERRKGAEFKLHFPVIEAVSPCEAGEQSQL